MTSWRIGLHTQATELFRDVNGDAHGATKRKDFISHCWKLMGESEKKSAYKNYIGGAPELLPETLAR